VFSFQAEDGIRDRNVTGVQTCALPIYRTRLRRREAMARPGHPLGRARLDLPRWSSPPRDHPVAQPRALETCPRARPEVRLLVRRGSGVLVGEALESVVCGVLTKMVGGVGDGEADLAVACEIGRA